MTTERPTVIGLGEVLWDCFDESRRPGGAPANVAFQANQLGGHGLVCSRVGDDALGSELIDYLREHGLSPETLQVDSTHPTSTVTVDTSQGGDHPKYVIHEGVAWDHLAWTDAWTSAFTKASAVCFGTLAQRSPESRATIRTALASVPEDCLTVFDVNLRQAWYDQETIEESLKLSRAMKLNDDEVKVISGLLGLSSELGPFCEAMIERYGIELVCVTRGAEGCVLVSADGLVDVPGKPVEVVDAVGAGDAFTAALIVKRVQGWPVESAATFANEIGGLVASHAGAMPDLRNQLADLKAKYSPS
ncbi:putative sugar kinase YdjH [Planctomycetes bacterium Pan216]|uniref:Putative sugar kinase YdjH n=1 Tax=Kolteria novifilia TaxID=2527975 RepID=A0A518B491_9BACT|nr:putative sugar kinase YdjH [Planctomycetes bacterium Pan216]